MKKSPLVSVIIPAKNEEENIGRCIKSIKKQSASIEIIVVDNFSTDSTANIARKMGALVFLKGSERSEQRNFGAKKAKGSWLLFLDADMEAQAGLIKECIEIVKDSFFTPMIIIPEIAVGITFWGKALALEKNCYKGPSWILAARFFPKKIFLKEKGYDESLNAGEDWDLTQRMENAGIPVFLAKKSFIYHHESQDSFFSLLKKESYYIKSIVRYSKKHPIAFSYQGSMLYRSLIWARSWRNLVKEPLLTSAFLFYKFIVWFMWMYYWGKFNKS